MASSAAVRDLVAWLVATFGDAVEAKVKGNFLVELEADLSRYTDEMVEVARAKMRTSLEELPPWANLTPILLGYLRDARDVVRSRDADLADRRQAEAKEAEQLREWIREPTVEELALLDGEPPEGYWPAKLHHRRCCDIRKRLETTEAAKREIRKRLDAIENDQPRRIA